MRNETQRHTNSSSVSVCSDGVRLEPGVHPAVQDIGVHPRQTNVGFHCCSTQPTGEFKGLNCGKKESITAKIEFSHSKHQERQVAILNGIATCLVFPFSRFLFLICYYRVFQHTESINGNRHRISGVQEFARG